MHLAPHPGSLCSLLPLSLFFVVILTLEWNGRKLNDGERTVLAIQSAEGKRMMYKQPTVPF
jgi:hypothetical protein